MNQAQLRKAIRDLIKNPKTTSDPHPFTSTKDLFPIYQHKFSPQANDILSVQTRNMIHQYNEPANEWSYLFSLIDLAALLGIKSAQNNPCQWVRKYSIVQCFGFKCRPHEVPEAAERIVEVVNYMAASGWINASLYNLGMMELGKYNNTDPDSVCVFSYLAVPSEHEQTVKSQFGFMMFAEGGVPPELR